MIEINCSKCKRPGQVLSANGLCWNCYGSKEKQRYRYLVNGRTQLLIYSVLLCIIFLLNALPTIILALSFTKHYSHIENVYIRNGKDIAMLAVYSVLKLAFALSIWKNRYQSSGSKYLNLCSDALLFIIKLGFMISYFANQSGWEQRLSSLTETISNYTEDNLSPRYLAFFLVFGIVFLVLRALMCVAAYILNIYYHKYFHEFFNHQTNIKRILNLAHWDLYYKSHPIRQQVNESLFVAAKVERPLELSEEFIRQDLQNYTKDANQIKRLVNHLLSQEESISIKESDLNIYFSYIKDKLSQWKEDNLPTENYLDTEVIEELTAKYNKIKERFTQCLIENKTYYEIMNSYTKHFETPLKLIMNHRHNVKAVVDQLYTNSNMLYQNSKSKDILNETLDLFDKQVINLSNVTLSIDHRVIEFDHILITNRGVFLIDIRTFDTSTPFEFVIERDGSWLKKIYVDGNQSRLEPLDSTAPSENSRNLLKVEKLINEELSNPLNQYMELKHIVINANDDLYIDNRSKQIIIRVGELMSTIRNYPILLDEAQMKLIEAIITKSQISSISYPIPNYRKIIIDQLDELLDKKLQLLRNNSYLIHQVNVVEKDLSTRHKLNFLPILIRPWN